MTGRLRGVGGKYWGEQGWRSDVSGLTQCWNSMPRLRDKRDTTYVAWILQNAIVPMSDPLKGGPIGVVTILEDLSNIT